MCLILQEQYLTISRFQVLPKPNFKNGSGELKFTLFICLVFQKKLLPMPSVASFVRCVSAAVSGLFPFTVNVLLLPLAAVAYVIVHLKRLPDNGMLQNETLYKASALRSLSQTPASFNHTFPLRRGLPPRSQKQ